MDLRIWNNRRIMAKSPLITTVLLEFANIGQIARMWHEHTAAGQSLISWLSVQAALWLWLNFFRLFNPEQRFAFWCQALGICLNMLVCLTVIYYRYFV